MRPPPQHQEELGRETKEMMTRTMTTTSPTRTSSSSSSHCHHQWAPHSSTTPAKATEREHMFEKVVTPSDVGKLNRLVIPKQHAERYFPLDPSSSADKGGLLLNFEEGPMGRPWRFRYSYWNSSQSYVMTKGWSRFVKDKRLDAGDTVSFSRSLAGDRFFIDWRRRRVPLPPDPPVAALLRSVVPTWYHLPPPLPLYFRPVPLPQMRVASAEHGILDSVPMVAHGPRAQPRKQVRLFGVNLYQSSDQQEEQPPAPSPLQWRFSAAAPAGRGSYNELQLMPMEEAKR